MYSFLLSLLLFNKYLGDIYNRNTNENRFIKAINAQVFFT